MIKQRKLKHKKNFDKRFHRNIHEFAVSRSQKKKRKKRKKEKFKSFLLTSVRDINRKLLEPFLVKSSAFIEAFVGRYS